MQVTDGQGHTANNYIVNENCAVQQPHIHARMLKQKLQQHSNELLD